MKIKKLTNQNFETSSFYLSCFLIASGLPLINTKRENNKVVWIFENSPDREKLIENFYNGSAQVSAIRLIEIIKRYKALIKTY